MQGHNHIQLIIIITKYQNNNQVFFIYFKRIKSANFYLKFISNIVPYYNTL